MSFRTIVVTKHSKISYKMSHIVIQTDEKIHQVPVDDISVLLIATTQSVVTGYAMMELLRHNVKVIFCDEKGIPIGEINGYFGNNSRNSNIQKQIQWQQERKHTLWQSIVRHKLLNQQMLLQDQRIDDTGFSELITAIEPGDVTNREAVGARMYFQRLYGSDFTRKNDEHPLNAKLNYGYQIFLAAMAREIHSAGYLTEIGVHHESMANEFNLASDFIEPFRPVIDGIVKHHMIDAFDLNMKLLLVDALNYSIRFNGHEAIITSAMADFVRQSFDYLEGKTEVPVWEIEL
ncbi:type II CRISPR-associated endonuclease Cas1 [Leuconostoc lactis]|uniref:type II CRISPR-associated endonuclease Cas1 n=1 Tax=Leuconostoc lactis TaxID=1246 RepID=UPI0015F4D917|nr:type II CRISPR-associated endonuclease Cas1 [Leuconostoc lactis]MBA5812657.1 type II CRISPR-associated endonuclease Cas1 [Leuconostoc lactis]